MQVLTVIEPFGKYAKGDQITDADEKKAAQSTNAHQVVLTELPDPPAAPAKATNA